MPFVHLSCILTSPTCPCSSARRVEKKERVNRRKSAQYIEPAHLNPLCFIPKDPNVLPIHHVVSPPVCPSHDGRLAGSAGGGYHRPIVYPFLPSHLTAVVSAQRTSEQKRNKSTKAANWYIFFLRRNLGNHSAKAKQKGENARKQAERETQYRKRKQQQQPARLGF